MKPPFSREWYCQIIIMAINMIDYGKMDGEKVLKSAISLYKQSNK